MKKYKIASIAGDGIGLEVVPPALKTELPTMWAQARLEAKSWTSTRMVSKSHHLGPRGAPTTRPRPGGGLTLFAIGVLSIGKVA